MHLLLRRISPVCKILMNSLGFNWSCTCASFSFTKNVSGVQICRWFFASTSLSSPGFFSKDNRGSCQNCRKYIVISKSCRVKYCKQKDHYNTNHALVYTFNLWRLINLTRGDIFNIWQMIHHFFFRQRVYWQYVHWYSYNNGRS